MHASEAGRSRIPCYRSPSLPRGLAGLRCDPRPHCRHATAHRTIASTREGRTMRPRGHGPAAHGPWIPSRGAVTGQQRAAFNQTGLPAAAAAAAAHSSAAVRFAPGRRRRDGAAVACAVVSGLSPPRPRGRLAPGHARKECQSLHASTADTSMSTRPRTTAAPLRQQTGEGATDPFCAEFTGLRPTSRGAW